MPPVAVGLGVRSATAAAAAVEKLVAELQATWPVHRTPFSVAGRDGGCLLDLRILPELAPCFVLAGDQLVVGWNPESRTLAAAAGRLPSGAGADAPPGPLAEADELRTAAAPGAPATRFDFGGRSYTFNVTRRGCMALEAELAGRTRS
jgi:hypothetical protein